MARRFDHQIVVMCKKGLATWVKAQAEKNEQSNAAATRDMLEESKRLRDVAEATGFSVDDILRQVEALKDATTPAR